jgi:hypothetical protein
LARVRARIPIISAVVGGKKHVFFYTHGFVHYEEYVASLRLTNGLKRNMIERNQMALQTQEQIIALTWLHCTLFSSDVQFISV